MRNGERLRIARFFNVDAEVAVHNDAKSGDGEKRRAVCSRLDVHHKAVKSLVQLLVSYESSIPDK